MFYLNGACRVAGLGYPVLAVCDGGNGDGVGLSMNAHFSNAKWVATPGRDFFFHGGLPPGAALTRDAYAQVQHQAKRLGIYEGVAFHPESYEPLPSGWMEPDFTEENAKYEVSVATDYAISLGRGRYCARVPVDRAQMTAMVGFLNDQNAPYRSAAQVFEWSVFRDNCIHLAHNALAVAGVWDEWRINRPLLVSVFDFPVPKNEFVNLMRRANDMRLLDVARAYRDTTARRSLAQYGRLPVQHSALATARGPQRPNDVYETELKLIFYDDPMLGPYQGWFDTILADPRTLDLRHNADAFAAAYRNAEAAQRPLAWWLAQPEYAADPAFPAFYSAFYNAVAHQRSQLETRPRLVTR